MNDYQIALHSMCETFCIYSHNCLTCDKSDCLKKNGVTQLKYLVENSDLIEKANKYTWHDLTKDPTDLPQDEYVENVLIFESYLGYDDELDDWVPRTAYAVVSYINGLFMSSGRKQKTLAWKYIDVFGGKNNG